MRFPVVTTPQALESESITALATRLRRLRYLSVFVLFTAAWLLLLSLSWVQYSHFALTKDFAIYHQAWYEIAHGNLNPREFVNGSRYYKNHLEILMWAFAPLYWVWPHSFWLLALQDTGVVGAALVAALWSLRLIEQSSLSRVEQRFLSVVALVLLLANPWFMESATFDFHFQDIAGFFLIMSAWQFSKNRNIAAFILAGLVTLTGNVSMTYLVALGFSVALHDRGRRLRGWAVVLIGIAGFLLSEHLGVNLGATVTASHSVTTASEGSANAPSLIVAILSDPSRMMSHLWDAKTNVYANIAPEGILGLANIWAFPIVVLLLIENALPGSFLLFSTPGFQSDPIYALLTVGTISVLIKAIMKKRNLGLVFGVLVIINVLGWAVAWTGRIVPVSFTDHITNSGASTLQSVRRRVPHNAEVVASQGILGRFAGRRYVLPFPIGHTAVPIKTKTVVFIVSPYEGIDVSSVSTELNRIAYLSHLPGSHLLSKKSGIWAFEWTHPRGVKSIVIPSSNTTPAWGLGTVVGTPVLEGSLHDWHMGTQSNAYGYVVNQAYWRLANGQYQVKVRIAESGPTNLEVWNATGKVLLRRVALPATNGIENITVPFSVRHQYPLHVYKGIGLFRMDPPGGSSPYDNIELRVWTPGHEIVSVYSLKIERIARKR